MGKQRRRGRSIDRRSLQASQDIRRHFPFIADTGLPSSDPEGLGILYKSVVGSRKPLFETGTVTWSGPGLDCYRVQLSSLSQSILCGRLSLTTGYPFGAKDIDVIPPGSEVLIYWDPHRPFGIILGVLPVFHPRWQHYGQSDNLLPGFVSGLYREPCHYETITRLFREGNLYDFSSHRPKDVTTAGERGWLTPTGVGVLVNDAEAFLRVDELCGLFLMAQDHYARLAGWNMDWETAGHQRQIRLDGGEIYDLEGFTPYYWEGLGMRSAGQMIAEAQEPRDVIFGDKPLGAYDLPAGERARVPFWRHTIYRGYLGQGELRYVTAPTFETSNLLGSSPAPLGLFREHLDQTGAYTIQSAKSIGMIKSCNIPSPVQLRLPEDAKDGDGSADHPYLFANTFGDMDGVVHDEWVGRDGDDGSSRTIAGAPDVISRLLNWTATHAFAKHEQDWRIPEESEGNDGLQSSQSIPFGDAKQGGGIPAPSPETRDISPTRKGVVYYQNNSYIFFFDDGTVELAGACGESIRMLRGDLILEAPGQIHIRSGGTTTIFGGDDVVVKARESIDLTTTEKNITVKAQRQFSVLAGNDDQGAGSGGILLESRGAGFDVERGGENAITGGIVLRSTRGSLISHSREVYLRTGGPGIDPGNITLDAAQGSSDLVLTARQHRRYGDYFLDGFGTNGTVRAVNLFSEGTTLLPGSLVVDGTVFARGEGTSIVGNGSMVVANGHFASSQARQYDGKVGSITGDNLTNLRSQLEDVWAANDNAARDVTEAWRSEFRDYLYRDPIGPGSRKFQQGIAFSLRDDEAGDQYGTQRFSTVEPKWFQMARRSGYSGTPWKERPVKHPVLGDLYPYPGKKALEGDTLLQYTPVLQGEDGLAKDRGTDGGPYGSPSMEQVVTPVKFNDNWKGL